MALRKGFTWGASTSAYQIEGATGPEYGRGPSIWEKYFAQRPHLDHGEVACGHYERMKEDVQMMKRMGLKAYRFSIAWPRVMPEGYGRVNEQGLAFYDSLIDELLAAGIEPYVTLYHWDLPLALGEIGGWTNREVCYRFADYAALCVKRFGDRVKNWATFNEPEVIVAGYIGDGLAPGLSNPKLRVAVGHHLMVAHGLALRAMREINSEIKVGIVLNLVPCEASDGENAEAVKAARTLWQRNYAWYLDGLFKARYPDVVLQEAKENEFSFEPGDMALISQKLDMLGINWYLRLVVNEKGEVVPVPGARTTQMGWEINPRALSRMLKGMQSEYRDLPPIYITENGAAIDDVVSADGQVHDPVRTSYIYEHLCALEKASKRGMDIRGYFAWSLMDNLEWSLGYGKTFGIVQVDRRTLKRTVKDSGLWYSQLIKRNSKKKVG
ncbi:MAG: beta-glucosidase [Cyanobacteria bacterium SZAS LIN-3]|nr:beta-glucosidase [Cyanobacteria bacterium SZAS LIN-3]MBS2010858.1 beta-glucosidase [Cyanobacteria bacterium SZAS TMP-1]